jgi:malonyl-CoA/methylmalonyl-CoA synthetase
VAAVVVAAADAEVADLTARVKAAAKDCMANFKAPKRVFLVDELPRNTMGKVQKNQLRETYKETFTTG